MANKKRIATSVAAVATAAALLLGGTFAWQSVNQTALNEASDVINPGGRLHDDFNGSNKDVYVENFAEENIFARVRLDEYFEITMNKGTPVENNEIVTVGAVKDDVDTYVTHQFDEANATDDYWTWTTGGETVYMPTFNLNKDSLEADINGTYAGLDGTDGENEGDDADRYGDYYEYYDGEEKMADATYDADANNIDEIAEGTATENVNYKKVSATHYATTTANASLMSMAEWQALSEEAQIGDYWVYDDDGWVYYAKPIPAGTATGLLLDGIELNQVMDDSWYYAINVVAQFVTADDLGKTDGTGFYDTEKGTVPSAAALELLKAIGVETEGATMVNDAAALQDALDKGEDVTIGEIEAGEASDNGLNFETDFTMTEGGIMEGGKLTSDNSESYATLFINNENNWPVDGDGAYEATVNGTEIETEAIWGVYVQAIDAPVTLNDMKVTGSVGGVYAEYSNNGNTVTLNNLDVTAVGGHTTKPWFNSAVAAGMGAKVEVNGGTYTAENDGYAAYVFSSGAELTINGGEFYGKLKEDNADLIIKGGTFDHDPAAFVAEGYEAVDNGNGTWTVQEEVFVDTIPPTVSVEKVASFNQIFTVSNVTENDFPLTVKMYYLATDAADYESEIPKRTITITKTDGAVEYSEHREPDDTAYLQGVTMVDDTVVIDYNLAPPEMCYLHAVVSDASGNEASANIKVPGAVGCFVAGTQVQTVNGLVNIEDIKVGDEVYSIDLSTGEKVVSTVAWVQGTRYIDATYTIYAGGETVEATYEHPFYVIGKEWVAAEDLTVGDVIKTMDGEAVITDIVYTELDAPVQVYNFTVEGTHNYLITTAGLLVHNAQK